MFPTLEAAVDAPMHEKLMSFHIESNAVSYVCVLKCF